MAGEADFIDLTKNQTCTIVVPDGGSLAGGPSPKIGIRHPGCAQLADIALDLDAFWCPECHWNGRVSGQWARDMIMKFDRNRG